MILRRLVLTLLLVQAALSQGGGNASIHGIVVNQYTGLPYPAATVELLSVQRGRVLALKSQADTNGEFHFSDLPAGSGYQIVVSGPRLQATAYGQRSWNEPWVSLTLEPGESLRDLQIAVQPLAVIRGKVVDAQGRGIQGARVAALKPVYKPARMLQPSLATSISDARGFYQFLNIPAGTYYIRVNPANGDMAAEILFATPSQADGSPRAQSFVQKEPEGYPLTYFPSTTDVSGAKPINLAAGGEVNDVDITVSRVRGGRVRGTVTYDGKPLVGGQVFLQRNGSASESNWTRMARISEGEFDIRGVLPGFYTLWSRTDDASEKLWSRTPVEVRGGETSTVAVKTAPAVDISGKLTVGSWPFDSPPNLAQYAVILIPNPLTPFDSGLPRVEVVVPARSVTPTPDGQFTFRAVIPGDYKVVVVPVPTGTPVNHLYLTSARHGNQELLESILPVSTSFEGSLDLVAAGNTGGLDGRVLNDGAGAAARVVLIPDARNRQDLYLAIMASPTGRFQLQGVPPGKYKIFAWADSPSGAWYDPDFLRKYEDKAVAVVIESGTAEYVELQRLP